jgi:beta-galactosidase
MKPDLKLIVFFALFISVSVFAGNISQVREKILINDNWKFYRYPDNVKVDDLIYDVRPEIKNVRDDMPADTKPTEKVEVEAEANVLKPWILPSGNTFIKDLSKRYKRPDGNPGENFSFVKSDFNDENWENIDLPHDWAIKGPFYSGNDAPVGGGMGRLPVQGVGWYRKKLEIPFSDKGKSIFLDVDGAMSYAIVWLNGKLVGGWPFGYSSWQLDLTPFIKYGETNQLSIRLDNPGNSSRWYPGAGIYRNVWLTKTNKIRVSHWGTFISAKQISVEKAVMSFKVGIENASDKTQNLSVNTRIFEINISGEKSESSILQFESPKISVPENSMKSYECSFDINNPKLWGPRPEQKPNLYLAVTEVLEKGKVIDKYETKFGIRDIKFDAEKGLFVNGQKIMIKGANQHHDLGSLGAAYNERASLRQLEMLQEAGCNAIRMSHNPPTPELLEMTDSMGFLVLDEIFDIWERKKTPHDAHLIFPDWHEQDLRSLIVRDRNHPSVIAWSFGNEVGEQYTDKEGAALAKKLYDIVKEEDSTRPATFSMNYAKPYMPLPEVGDLISLNYQGEGIRNGGLYSGLKGITTPPLFPAFHEKFPGKMILSSENASTLSSRGEYLFPVTSEISSPIRDGQGGDSKRQHVSAYELYSVDFGASPDKVFLTLDKHPYVAGGFVWTGWDHIGEPTPYYNSRSSYCGIIDLAGFKKDRFYLYQSYWRPDFPMAHILPHWTWPDRIGKVTPVHVFTSGDEAELFVNGVSMGKKKKGSYEYRLRWDSVTYSPGSLKVIAYKNGIKWASDSIKTATDPKSIFLTADRGQIKSDGKDLSFITLKIVDKDGNSVSDSGRNITFSVDGPGEIVSTDNGDPSDMVSFAAHERKVFNGLCLVVVKAKKGFEGIITIEASASDLVVGVVKIRSVK